MTFSLFRSYSNRKIHTKFRLQYCTLYNKHYVTTTLIQKKIVALSFQIVFFRTFRFSYANELIIITIKKWRPLTNFSSMRAHPGKTKNAQRRKRPVYKQKKNSRFAYAHTRDQTKKTFNPLIFSSTSVSAVVLTA